MSRIARSHGSKSDVSQRLAGAMEAAIGSMLTGLLVFGPLAFGMRDPASQLVFLGVATLCLALVVARAIVSRSPEHRLRWSWTYMPMALFLGLLVLQQWAFPAGWVKTLSPFNFSVWNDLVGPVAESSSMTLSLYPHQTRHDLRLILALVMIFITVFHVYRDRWQVARLLGAVAATGAIVALLPPIHRVLGLDAIYGVMQVRGRPGESAPFANYNHFGQFMLLSLGATAALGLVWAHGVTRALPGLRGDTLWRSMPQNDRRWLVVLLAVVMLQIFAIVLSSSRGATASLVVAGAVMIIGLAMADRSRPWLSLGFTFGLGVAALVGYTSLELVTNRFSTLAHEIEQPVRLQIVRDLWGLFAQTPIFGIGHGAHGVVYPMVQQIELGKWFAYADCDYAQVMAETGLIGMVAVGMFLALIAAAWVRCVRQGSKAWRWGAFGLGFGLLAILLQSVGDYGQRIPAIATLTAIFCACILNLGWAEPEAAEEVAADDGDTDRPTGANARSSKAAGVDRPSTNKAAGLAAGVVQLVALVAVGLAGAWMLGDGYAAHQGDRAWQASRVVDQAIAANPPGTPAQHAERLRLEMLAWSCEPNRADLAFWVNLHRFSALLLAGQDQDPPFSRPSWRENTQRVADEIASSRMAAPTYGRLPVLEGQIRWLLGDRERALELVDQSIQLGPNDVRVNFVSGMILAEAGDSDRAVKLLRHACVLEPDNFLKLAPYLMDTLGRSDLALALADGHEWRLARLMDMVRNDPERQDLRNEAYERMMESIARRVATGKASANDLAGLGWHRLNQQRFEEAESLYRKALGLNYGNVEWRFTQARILARLGRISEAMDQLRICIRLSPTHQRAINLLKELSVDPAGFDLDP